MSRGEPVARELGDVDVPGVHARRRGRGRRSRRGLIWKAGFWDF